jgi:hypothetical protein
MQNSKRDLASSKSVSPLHFARFEFKYILSAAKRQAVEKDLSYFLEYDPFVADKEDHQYFVRSLYYDDPHNTAFHDKIDGLHSRSKFRVRTYSRSVDTEAPFYLEIKGRHNNLVYKHRTPVNHDDSRWAQLSGGEFTQNLIAQTEKSDVLDAFQYQLYRKRLRPVALIDYRRRPYVSKYDPSFRITFDERLKATKTDTLFPGRSAVSHHVISGYTIVEVKFKHHLPSWFHQVIQAHELQRVSISKIVSGMEKLGIARDEN